MTKSETVIITVSLERDFLTLIDDSRGLVSRSAFIVDILKEKLMK